MRIGTWLRISRAERRLSKPMFVVYAIFAIAICFLVWFGSLKLSENMQSNYTKMQKQVESVMYNNELREEAIE